MHSPISSLAPSTWRRIVSYWATRAAPARAAEASRTAAARSAVRSSRTGEVDVSVMAALDVDGAREGVEGFLKLRYGGTTVAACLLSLCLRDRGVQGRGYGLKIFS